MPADLAVATAAEHPTDPPLDRPDPVSEARAAVTVGLYVSATRCVLTYLVAPSLGLLGVALGVTGLLLQIAGLVSSAWGALRLYRLGSRWWPAYVALALLVGVGTALALVGGPGPGGAA